MTQRSLRRQLAIWLVGVLSALLLVDAWYSYGDALRAANQAYDRSLSASIKGIAERIHATDQEIVVDIPYSALELFESGSSDRVFYSVGVQGAAEVLTGYEGLPQPQALRPNEPVFYDGIYKAQPVRWGALLKPLYRAEFPQPVLVILGETTNSRQEVVQQLFWGEIWRKAAMVVVALLVALFATAVAVKPVEHLGAGIRARPEEDLTPIAAADVPLEVVPLVDAINHHMGRIDQMIQARRRFITDAAHQLRTPLAVLNTQAEYALRQDHISEMRAAITALHRSLGSAIRLTNQLLSLSRAEPINGLMLTRQPVDLAALARDTVIELLPLAARKSIDLGLEGTEQPVIVAGNPVLLREMLTNLIDNALRYTPSGGLVTVRVDQAGGAAPHARLHVSDTGVGIPAAQREAVFHRFFRLDSTDHSGSGLGLSIVREIVLGHGGEIHITDPQNGPGVVVVVNLPLVG